MIIVTAYYSIPSKQNLEFYQNHIKRFFKNITIPILFFTDAENYSWLKPIASNNCTFILREFDTLPIFQGFPKEFWELQITRDPELYHTWQVGALWANKSHFVNEAIKIQNTSEDWYMWMDAGCIRKDEWEPYLNDFGHRNFIKLEPGIYVQGLRDVSKIQPTLLVMNRTLVISQVHLFYFIGIT